MSDITRTQRWYFKISESVDGPITGDEVIARLLNGELSVVHQVSSDRQSWNSICNEPFFEKRVAELVAYMEHSHVDVPASDQFEDKTIGIEKTTTFDIQKINAGISAQLKHAEELIENTQNLATLRKLQISMNVSRKRAVGELSSTGIKPPVDVPIKAVKDGVDWAKVLQENGKILTALFSILILAAVGHRGFEVFSRHQAVEQERLAQERAQKELEDKVLATYDKIAKGRQTSVSPMQDPEALLEVSQAMVKEKDYATSDQVNDKILAMTNNSDLRARTYSTMGESRMARNDFAGAEKSFSQALKENPKFHRALYRQGEVYLKTNRLSDAETSFLRLIERGHTDAPTLLSLFEVAYKTETDPQYLKRGNPEFQRLSRVDRWLAAFSQKSLSYRAEILVARLLIAAVRGSDLDTERLGYEFVGLNPETTQREERYRRYDAIRVDWPVVYAWCSDAFERSKKTALMTGVMASCLLQVQKFSDARKFSLVAFQTSPSEPLLKGIHGYALFRDGDFGPAKTLFGMDDHRRLPKLGLLVLARLCERENDIECALKYWTRLYNQDSSDSSAFLGMIRANIAIQNYPMVKRLVQEGRDRQPASTTEDLEKIESQLLSKRINLWAPQ